MDFIFNGLDAISRWVLDNIFAETGSDLPQFSALDQTLLAIALVLGFVMFLFIGVHGMDRVNPAIWVLIAQWSPQWYVLVLLPAAIAPIRTGMLIAAIASSAVVIIGGFLTEYIAEWRSSKRKKSAHNEP